MENDTEEEEWVPSSVFVEQYGYRMQSIAVFSCVDRKSGRTDRIKKIGHRLYVNTKSFSRRPFNGNNLNHNWRGKDLDAEYGFNEIAQKLGMTYADVYRVYERAMRKIAKLLGSQSPL